MNNNFRQRYTKSLQQQSFPISDARILTSASIPFGKSSPKRALILILAAVGRMRTRRRCTGRAERGEDLRRVVA